MGKMDKVRNKILQMTYGTYINKVPLKVSKNLAEIDNYIGEIIDENKSKFRSKGSTKRKKR